MTDSNVPTRRERQIIELLAQSKCNKDIAEIIGLSEGTIKIYLSRFYKRTGLTRCTAAQILTREHERTQAVVLNEWVQKWKEILPPEAYAQIRTILGCQVAEVLGGWFPKSNNSSFGATIKDCAA